MARIYSNHRSAWARSLGLALAALIGAGVAPISSFAGKKEVFSAPYAPDRVLVAFHPNAAMANRVAAIQRLSLTVQGKQQSPHFAVLQIPAGAMAGGANVPQVIAELKKDPSVRVAEPDYLVQTALIPNDTRFGELYGLHNAGQSGGTADADIDAPEAWDVTTGSPSVVVAVIDTGVDYTHPDLQANILKNGSTVVGFDFANNDADPMDDNGHGTHCAGTIGAVGNNSLGVIGVCPQVRIMPLKFLAANGSGSLSAAIQCIDFARQNGAHIMSNSWGGGGFSQLLLESIQRAEAAGILFVAAAGNNSSNNDTTPSFPCNYNQQAANVVSVASSDRNDLRSSFSNFGATTVDIAAPGSAILSTTPNNTYSVFNGTSMATPHVSGTAALVKARNPSFTAAQLKSALLDNVDQPAGLNGAVRTGRLNAARALQGSGGTISGRVIHTVTSQGIGGLTVSASRPGVSTSTQTNSPALPIPDNNAAGIETTMSVSEPHALASLSVGVNITHTYRGDLQLTLVHPDGTPATFFGLNAPASDSADNIVGTFPVTSFNGKPMAGTWKLQVRDLAGADLGTLNSWSLVLGRADTVTQSVTTAADGTYAFPQMPNATYTVAPSGGTFTFTPASRQVTVAPNATGVDFNGMPPVPTFTMSGRVAQGGNGLGGVTVTATGAVTRTATTNPDGTYLLSNLPAGAYTVSPSGSQPFSPASRQVTVGPSQANVDFQVGVVFTQFTLSLPAVRGKLRTFAATVLFSGPVPTATPISFTSSHPSIVPVPRTGNLPAGASTGSLTLKAKKVKAPTVVTITASSGGVTFSRTITVSK